MIIMYLITVRKFFLKKQAPFPEIQDVSTVMVAGDQYYLGLSLEITPVYS